MKKTQIICPADAREYIDYQFKGLAQTLELFDYNGMADMVRATRAVFSQTSPDTYTSAPDCILLEVDKIKG